MSENSIEQGLSRKGAKRLELGIIGFCILSMAFIFQPLSQTLFSIGCIGVVLGGLAFNLVPFCKAGVTVKKIRNVAITVAIVFVVVVILALASAWGYGLYLKLK